jgi:hypothetical protein
VLADLQEVLTRTLEQTGGPELVRAFLEQLKLQHVRQAVSRLLTRADMATEVSIVDADADNQDSADADQDETPVPADGDEEGEGQP